MRISHESFLINEEGLIIKHWEKVKPTTHSQEVLEIYTPYNKNCLVRAVFVIFKLFTYKLKTLFT